MHIYHIFIESCIYNFAIALSQFKNFLAVFTPEKVTLKNVEKCKNAVTSDKHVSKSVKKYRNWLKSAQQVSRMIHK